MIPTIPGLRTPGLMNQSFARPATVAPGGVVYGSLSEDCTPSSNDRSMTAKSQNDVRQRVEDELKHTEKRIKRLEARVRGRRDDDIVKLQASYDSIAKELHVSSARNGENRATSVSLYEDKFLWADSQRREAEVRASSAEKALREAQETFLRETSDLGRELSDARALIRLKDFEIDRLTIHYNKCLDYIARVGEKPSISALLSEATVRPPHTHNQPSVNQSASHVSILHERPASKSASLPVTTSLRGQAHTMDQGAMSPTYARLRDVIRKDSGQAEAPRAPTVPTALVDTTSGNRSALGRKRNEAPVASGQMWRPVSREQ